MTALSESEFTLTSSDCPVCGRRLTALVITETTEDPRTGLCDMVAYPRVWCKGGCGYESYRADRFSELEAELLLRGLTE